MQLETKKYNPDVLTCLANLSNDEVFTPPLLANRVLDLLPDEIWSNKDLKFLDPVSKSGVFLREIGARLMNGLKSQIPDIQERANHIYHNQLFGIAITELTSLLSRRTAYCSKSANGQYSICELFNSADGNIRYERNEHTWEKGKCLFCGAKKDVYDRSDDLETHAYEFIHTEQPEEIFNMKFDVIVGNPPYQLSDAGFGKSASPIYHKFIQQAKKMNPRYLTMIIPSRWFAGGKGLDDFRENFLSDQQTRKLIDFADATDCFPGVDIAGGVCYFLWEKGSKGPCEVTHILKGKETTSLRHLDEFRTFVRHGDSVPIINKVMKQTSSFMNTQVSSRKPFGLSTNVRPSKKGDLILRWNGGEGPFPKSKITIGKDLIDTWKVITSKVSYDHGGQPDKNGMRRVLSIVDILPPGTVCTETYIIAGAFSDHKKAKNLANYLCTKFVRFLVSQLSFSQDITKERFQFVPILDMGKVWTDTELYSHFNLTDDEISHIEDSIKEMEFKDE